MKNALQRFGKFLSAMVMPNIGAFIAWGFITALFIPDGWLPNEKLASIHPYILFFLLPILIAGQGGQILQGILSAGGLVVKSLREGGALHVVSQTAFKAVAFAENGRNLALGIAQLLQQILHRLVNAETTDMACAGEGQIFILAGQ